MFLQSKMWQGILADILHVDAYKHAVCWRDIERENDGASIDLSGYAFVKIVSTLLWRPCLSHDTRDSGNQYHEKCLILCTQYGTVEEEKGSPMYLNQDVCWFDCSRPFIETFLTVC